MLLQDRPPAGRPQRDIAAADETKRSVIEVVAVEFVDRLTERAGTHERVYVLVEEHVDGRCYLIGVVSAGDALVRLWVVRLTDAGEQQQMDVVLGEGTKDHEFCRLLEFAALHVDIRHAGRALAGGIKIDAGNVAKRPIGEVVLREQHGKDRGLGRRLRVVAAGEPFAKAAVGALTHLHAVRVLVRLRRISGGAWKRF